MPLRFFTETRTGEIQSRLANDVGGVQAVVTDTARASRSPATSRSRSARSSRCSSSTGKRDPLAGDAAVLHVPDVIASARSGATSAASETQVALAEMSAATEETAVRLRGCSWPRPSGNRTHRSGSSSGPQRDLAAPIRSAAMVGRWFFMIIGTIFSITPAFVYWLAGTMAANGNPDAASAGAIVAFTTLQSRLFFPLGQLLNIQVEIQGSLALFDRIFEYLEMDPEIVDAPDAVALEPAAVQGHVRLHDVSFRYPTEVVPSARAHAAVGQHDHDGGAGGAGHTTPRHRRHGRDRCRRLGRRAGRRAAGGDHRRGRADRRHAGGPGARARPDVRPGGHRVRGHSRGNWSRSSGPREWQDHDHLPDPAALRRRPGSRARSTGTDIRRIKLQSLGQIIGVVTQETYLFHASVRDNLMYARPDANEDELVAAATAGGDPRPDPGFCHDGYDTIVGERGYKLSGGESSASRSPGSCSRTRASSSSTRPTSALDTVSERLIQAAFEHLMEGRTTIAIAHRLSTILRADRILVYEKGHIVERGTHTELIALDGLYARLYREQFLADRPVEAAAGLALPRCPPTRTVDVQFLGGSRFHAVPSSGRRESSSTTASRTVAAARSRRSSRRWRPAPRWTSSRSR